MFAHSSTIAGATALLAFASIALAGPVGLMGRMIGEFRWDALLRVLALLAYVTFGWIISVLAVLAGLIWMIIDVLIQGAFNSPGWEPDGEGMAKQWLERLYYWHVDLLEWIFFGSRDAPLMP